MGDCQLCGFKVEDQLEAMKAALSSASDGGPEVWGCAPCLIGDFHWVSVRDDGSISTGGRGAGKTKAAQDAIGRIDPAGVQIPLIDIAKEDARRGEIPIERDTWAPPKTGSEISADIASGRITYDATHVTIEVGGHKLEGRREADASADRQPGPGEEPGHQATRATTATPDRRLSTEPETEE